MENRCGVHSSFCAICIAVDLIPTAHSAAAEHGSLLFRKEGNGTIWRVSYSK